MIIVHHLNDSRSQRVLWLLEELGLDYEVKRYQRDARTMLAPPELKAIHPLGKSPVIEDAGVKIAETGAIIEYLVDRYGAGKLAPPYGTPQRLNYVYWLHYAEGSAMTPLLLKLVFTRIPQNTPGLIRPLIQGVMNKVLARLVEPQLKNHAAFWEKTLTENTWFAGEDFTAADIMMSFPLETAVARGTFAHTPQVLAFVAAVHSRPAYQRALERGGPYSYAT